MPSDRKNFPLRLEPKLHAALEKWAADKPKEEADKAEGPASGAEVVSLDAFRKKS